MNKWTPGPWMVVPACDDEVDSPFDSVRVAPFRYITCEGRNEMEANANAHLIAAAPEIADALADALCALECCGKDYDYVVGKARAALAKARGES